MNLPYPQSVHCSFENFPAALDIRLGPLASTIIEGSSIGSKFVLTQTPKSGVLQGDYAVGELLPDLRIIYSDTGGDDDFSVKISFFGYGTFYKLTDSDVYLRFQVYKGIAIETSLLGEKIFGDTFDCETLITAGKDTTAEFSYDGVSTRYSETIESNDATFTYNGQTFVLANGASITFHSESGGTGTVTNVGGMIVIEGSL